MKLYDVSVCLSMGAFCGVKHVHPASLCLIMCLLMCPFTSLVFLAEGWRVSSLHVCLHMSSCFLFDLLDLLKLFGVNAGIGRL